MMQNLNLEELVEVEKMLWNIWGNRGVGVVCLGLRAVLRGEEFWFERRGGVRFRLTHRLDDFLGKEVLGGIELWPWSMCRESLWVI